MAVFDPDTKKLVVRVVYDGPGMAGKTTNLQRLCEFFPPQRRSDLYSGQTVADRTLCLDWMQLDGGLVRGHELRCHLLTVPGQAVLSRRRQMILTLADTVVFVLESTEQGLKQAQSKWRSLFACTGGPAVVPIVIQANKQDAPGALSPAEIRERWRLDANIPVVTANAATGQGVRETLVLAMRAAAVLLQETLAGAEVSDIAGAYESGPELERRILEHERDNPMSATEIVLAARRSSATPRPKPAATLFADSERPAAASSAPPAHLRLEELAAAGAAGSIAPRASRAASGAASEPPLPGADAPTGCIWPALEGRTTLGRIPRAEAVRHAVVRAARPGRATDDADAIVYEAGIWCLKTHRKRRFASAEGARDELVRLARAKLALGSLCAPRTVLAVQPDAEGGHWLWSVCVWLTTLDQELEKATNGGDDAALGAALGHFARATLQALRICLDSNVVLDLQPRHFGLLADEVFYLSDDLESGPTLPRIGQAILRRFDEYSRCSGALATYREVLERGLTSGFTWPELERLELLRALGGTIVSTEAGRRGRAELAHALSAMRASVT